VCGDIVDLSEKDTGGMSEIIDLRGGLPISSSPRERGGQEITYLPLNLWSRAEVYLQPSASGLSENFEA
jgi:hypothetical protein